MDYKHRVPGNKKPKRSLDLMPRPWLLPVVGGAVVIFVMVGLWFAFSGGSAVDEQGPVSTTMSQPIEVPPIGPPTPPPERVSGSTKGEGKRGKIAKEAVSGNSAIPDAVKKTAEKESRPEDEHAPPSPPPAEIRFTFYKILPEKEVLIPESEVKSIKRDEKLGNVQKSEQYLIQVGSYDTVMDAQKVRSRLSELKVKSRIESLKVESTEWHRVYIGPFDKVLDADRVRDYLRLNQIATVVQKSKAK